MAFDSLNAFLAMGGHGPYVWTCYAVLFLLWFVFIAWSKKQRRSALQSVARRDAMSGAANPVNASADFARVGSAKLPDAGQINDGNQNASSS